MSTLNFFFKPKSVAVIGASKTPGKIGYAILNGLIKSGFKGKVFPVNPKEKSILGLECYKDPVDIKGKVDLGVIAVPDRLVNQVARQCGEAGFKGLVVVTAGFKEIGTEGLQREKELVAICKQYNMRLLGPNCVGLMDTHTPINASFASQFPLSGGIAFISQSGAMLISILDWSLSEGVGFSKVISLGNKADLNEADFIRNAAEDPNTKVILCYIEDVAIGNEFLKVAREVTRKKPIIVLKSGTSQAGAQAATSHTGALAGSDLAYETAFNQTGVIRARTMSELFDLAAAFINQPIPRGDRVAIITNSGGPGIITTDCVERNGLKMARFNKKTIEYLREQLPPEASFYNPVDVLGDAKTDRYRYALEKVLQDDNVDNVLVLLCHTAVTEPEQTAKAIVDLKRLHPDKTLFAAYMGGEGLKKGARILSDAGIPCFTFPEPAVEAIKGLVKYGGIVKNYKEEGISAFEDVDQKTVKAVFYDVIRDRRLVLLGSEAAQVAQAYGIPVSPTYLATSINEACQYSEKIGYPVVLKVSSPKIIHKSDIGGVKVGLCSADEVKEAFTSIIESARRFFPETRVYGVEIQKMMPKGTELIIGMSRDIQFGPLVAFGLGGIYVNLLKDISFRLSYNLSMAEIEKMITETKAYTLLRGYRGSKPADIGAIVNTIARVARLSLDFPEISEMDINPILAYEKDACALDVKITISES